MEGSRMRSPALLWHFGGLGGAAGGAWLLAGLPGVLIVLGIWAMVASLADMIVRYLVASRRW